MSQSSRISLVTSPHKGIRYAFAQLGCKAGSLDFADQTAVADLKNQLVEFGELLEEHADLENRFILTALEERAPGSARHDEEDHKQLHFMQENLLSKLDAILALSGSPAEAARLGYEFYQDFGMLHAAHLEHMMEEETVTQNLMWKHFTDEELRGLHGQIVGSIPPPVMLAWMQFILPASTRGERADMLKGMQANAPAPFFMQVMTAARQHLPTGEFEKLEESLAQFA